MKAGDYTVDPLGGPRGVTSYNAGTFTFPNIVNPYNFAFTPFQCHGAGNPIPANPDGSQNPGTNCNKIPSNMFDPAANSSVDPTGLAMITPSPHRTHHNTTRLTNVSTV